MTAPLIIVHRRNRVDLLAGLPTGCWIEVDVDLYDGTPCLSHDPVTAQNVEQLDAFLTRALIRGVAGFIFDCKRENVEKAVKPLLAANNISNYFYLNEMEVQGDIFLNGDANHRTAIRIWQYRGAADVIRYVEEMKTAHQNFPGWIWVDCWRRGLREDIGKAFIPLGQTDAHKLQLAGVKLCICSPELYVHDYEKNYAPDDLQAIYRGVVRYRHLLMQTGISADAVCTKFPWLWTLDVDLLLKARDLGA